MLWRKVINYWPTVVVAGAIVYGSLMRAPGSLHLSVSGADKWIHGALYMVLGGVWMWNYSGMECVTEYGGRWP